MLLKLCVNTINLRHRVVLFDAVADARLRDFKGIPWPSLRTADGAPEMSGVKSRVKFRFTLAFFTFTALITPPPFLSFLFLTNLLLSIPTVEVARNRQQTREQPHRAKQA